MEEQLKQARIFNTTSSYNLLLNNKYHQSKPKFKDVYSRNNLPQVKDGACVKHLNEYKSIGTHWILLYVNGDDVTYFDSFGVEYISKKVKKLLGNKNITTKTYRIQAIIQ